MKTNITMGNGLKKKQIKDIHVNVDKCTGCRACEMACSAFHAQPRYSSSNPARSRIRVLTDEFKDAYVPVRAGHCPQAECAGRYAYTLGGKTYAECSFCRAPCPSRGYFKEPDSCLPLKCDMCEADPPLKEPMCVQVCRADALTFTEREEVGDQALTAEDLDAGLEQLARKHGLQKLVEIVERMSKTGKLND